MNKELALAELLGVLCGDGCLSISRRTSHTAYCVYCCGNKLKDKQYMKQYVPRLFRIVFGKTLKAKERTDENVIYIRTSDKELFTKLHALGLPVGKKYAFLCIPDFALKTTARQLAFARGVFDTDGCVVLSKQHRVHGYYPRIEITSKSFPFLKQVFSVLKQCSFNGSISKKGKDCYRLELAGFKNLTLWRSLIGSSNTRNLLKIHEANKKYINAAKASPYICPGSSAVERA